MRVLHIDGGRRWAGGQNQIRLLMRHLAGAGIEQLCLCPAGSPLAARLERERLPVHTLTWRRGTDPRAFAAIARAVRVFDLLHCHDAHALQLAIAPARLARRPVVAARRVCFRTSGMKWNLATRVIAISDAVRRVLVESGVDADRIRLVHSGIDADEVKRLEPGRPSLRERLGLGPDAFVAGNIGTLLEFKNQTLVPRAAAHAADLDWVIIGDGPRRAAIEAEIESHGVRAAVHMAGSLPDARRYLAELDVFVFTSLGEALGTSILDAMARGVPVVAVEDGGPAEILAPVHARTGASLVPPGDAAALAAAVRRVRDDVELRRRMIDAQHERVRDFGADATARATFDVYCEVVPAGAARVARHAT